MQTKTNRLMVKCSRCRYQCAGSDWLLKPTDRGYDQKVCPRCGCTSYYDMTPQVAWCWASGLIEVGDQVPAYDSAGGGAIEIATGPKSSLFGVLSAVARLGKGESAGSLVVPGVPESDSQQAKGDALEAWLHWCASGNGKKHRLDVIFKSFQGGG
jgi:hypothetical protein